MKNNTKLIALVAMLATYTTYGAKFVVENGNDDVNMTPIIAGKQTNGKTNFSPIRPRVGENSIFISSVASLTSPNTGVVRQNVMKGLAGGDVPFDRTEDPTAWYQVPHFGWQWFDLATTTVATSYLGLPNPTNSHIAGEHGHRLVISKAVVGNPANYFCRITTSLTNIAPAFFPISTNSSGQPLVFSYTYVGLDLGPNSKLDSTWSDTENRWNQLGDDVVYDGRQASPVYPSDDIDFTMRFGATVVITADDIADFQNLMDQFATAPAPTITAELVTNGVTVASSTVSASLPDLAIHDMGNGKSRVSLVSGQSGIPHRIESAPEVVGPWIEIPNLFLLRGSQGYFDSPNVGPRGFYRARAVRSY